MMINIIKLARRLRRRRRRRIFAVCRVAQMRGQEPGPWRAERKASEVCQRLLR